MDQVLGYFFPGECYDKVIRDFNFFDGDRLQPGSFCILTDLLFYSRLSHICIWSISESVDSLGSIGRYTYYILVRTCTHYIYIYNYNIHVHVHVIIL